MFPYYTYFINSDMIYWNISNNIIFSMFPVLYVSVFMLLKKINPKEGTYLGFGFHGRRWYLSVYLSGLEAVVY